MNQNQSKDTYQKVTNIIISLLESEQNLEFKKPWVSIRGGAPSNAISKKGYRGINFFLLSIIAMLKGYNINKWMTVKQANQAGARIRKGEKASPVALWKKTYFDKNGNRYTPEQVRQMAEAKAKELTSKTMLTEYAVFNVAQIEGLPSEYYLIPSCRIFNEFEKDEEAEQLLNLSGAKISYHGNMAYYHSGNDEIVLPPRKQFNGTEPFYSTVFHELAHWTGHPTRLNRIKKSEDGKKDYALEELIAELTTAFVCSSIGFDSQMTNNAAYLRNWIDALKEDNKIIFRISSDAQKAADFILQPIQHEVEQAA